MTDRDGSALGTAHAPSSGSRLPASVNGDASSSSYPDAIANGTGAAMAVNGSQNLVPLTCGSIVTDPCDRGRECLSKVFAGELPRLPLEPAPSDFPGRRPIDHYTLARVLGCQDLFAVDCPVGAVRERIIADVALAADSRERILILSPDPAAADRLAESIGSRGACGVVRALGEQENPLRPLPAVNRFTSVALGAGRVEHMKKEAAATVLELEEEIAAATRSCSAIADLRPVVDAMVQLDRELAGLHASRDSLEVAVQVEADATPPRSEFGFEIERLRTEREAVCQPLSADRAKLSARRSEKETLLASERRNLDAVVAKPGFLSRLLGLSRIQTDTTELERRIQVLASEIKEIIGQEAAYQAEYEAACRRFAAERDKRIAAELARRREEIDVQIAKLSTERQELDRRFGEKASAIDHSASLGLAPTGESLDQVEASLQSRQQSARIELAAARQQQDDLGRDGPDMARRFLAEARVIVGIPASLASDPVFESSHARGSDDFGLLVLDHAEELTEADFIRLSALARRWLLLGDSTRLPQCGPHRDSRPRRPDAFYRRILDWLDAEPWSIHEGRLVCRLAHPIIRHRRALTCEPVIDRPEIELRLSSHEGEALVAEIAFPADTPIAEMKRFLFSELGEVVLRPCGELQWHQNDDFLLACWPAVEAAATAEDWVELDDGVREKTIGFGAESFTAAVAFEISRGWDRPRAEIWLRDRLPRYHSRVAFLGNEIDIRNSL